MSQVALNANNVSAIFNTLMKSKVSDFFSYDLSGNSPNQTNINVIKVQPRSLPSAANIPGSEISFRLPRNGLVSDVCFKVSVTGSAADATTDTNLLGAKFFSQVSLKSNSKTIHSYNDTYMVSRFKNHDMEKAANLIPLLGGSIGVNTSSAAVFIVPFYSTFLDSTSTYLDLSFLEEMSIDCKFNSLVNMGLGTNAMSAFDIELWIRYVNMDQATKDAYWSNNFKNPQLNMLITDVYQETDKLLGAADTSVTMEWKCPYAVKRSFFYLCNTLTANMGPTTVTSITDMSLRLSGQLAFDSVPTEVFKYFSLKDNPANLVVQTYATATATTEVATLAISTNASNSGDVWVVNYGQSDSTLFNSGCIAMKDVNNPQLTVNLNASVGTANAIALRCVHEILKLTTIDSASGYIESSFSS